MGWDFTNIYWNFIRPYEGTQELITDEMVNRRVKFYNCEMRKRPRIAKSKLAQTTVDTIHCLSQLSKKPIDSTALKNVTEAINDLLLVITNKSAYRKQMKPMWKLL